MSPDAAPRANDDALFLRACRRESLTRPPIWMMRQAGRYLPEYMEIRSQASFLDLCHDADLALEVSMQPIRRFDFDAAIIFSDILIPLIGMGADFRFGDGGPKLSEGFETAEDFEKIRQVDARKDLPWIHEALAKVRAELDPSKALLGFGGAPFTMLAYLVEGETSRLFPKTKSLLYNQPKLAEEILQRLAEMMGEYLAEQIQSGADAVQLFDTWAGLLSPDDFERFALPYARQVFDRVSQTGAPSIYYLNGGAHLLEAQCAAGSDIVSVDWRMRLTDVRRRVPDNVGIQGNLDPLALLGSPEFVGLRTEAMLKEMDGRPGYICNLGHGVIPQTPIPSVAAFVDTTKAHQSGV